VYFRRTASTNGNLSKGLTVTTGRAVLSIGEISPFHSQPGKSALYRHLCFYAPSANLIRYNSCDGEVRHACAMDGEKNGKDDT
jgi:hypothetical protein